VTSYSYYSSEQGEERGTGRRKGRLEATRGEGRRGARIVQYIDWLAQWDHRGGTERQKSVGEEEEMRRDRCGHRHTQRGLSIICSCQRGYDDPRQTNKQQSKRVSAWHDCHIVRESETVAKISKELIDWIVAKSWIRKRAHAHSRGGNGKDEATGNQNNQSVVGWQFVESPHVGESLDCRHLPRRWCEQSIKERLRVRGAHRISRKWWEGSHLFLQWVPTRNLISPMREEREG
jgi:hypothetical protein